jgi:16S rRNA (uracil1498-N3)-methyltransferase
VARPVYRVAPAVIDAGTGVARLAGPEARHAVTVARVTPGETVDLVDGAGGRARAVVHAAIKPDQLDVEILEVHREAAPAPRIVVVQAVIKGDRAERAVETMTEVGVDAIVPWQAERSIARWDGKADRARARWQTAADEAAKQSRRAWAPEITAPRSLAEIRVDVAAAALAVLLDDEADACVGDISVPSAGDVVLVVGPEGGCTDAERTALIAAGAVPAHLGPTILRAATAGTVGAAVLLARTARWDLAGSRHE